MTVNDRHRFNSCCLYSKKTLTFASLLFMVAIISASFISASNGLQFIVNIWVENETELRNAINTAPDEGHVIAIMKDIVLEKTLEIPNGKKIVLGGGANNFVRLIGGNGITTITVKSGGTLILLDGIVVTHAEGDSGRGVFVEGDGVFELFDLCDSVISGNTVDHTGFGGGVYNAGTFTMNGGKITNNSAGYGGGVYNVGTFVISRGEITNNHGGRGGGVYNDESFEMFGGVISSNVAESAYGGGVCNWRGTFTMSGGEISGNQVWSNYGGGVFNRGDFTLSNGRIFNNHSRRFGGGVANVGTFIMTGGEISKNTSGIGGGVYNNFEITYNKSGGKISSNTATIFGGGNNVYNAKDNVAWRGNQMVVDTFIGSVGVRDLVVVCVCMIVCVAVYLLFYILKRQTRQKQKMWPILP